MHEWELKMLQSIKEELEYERESMNQEIEQIEERLDELAKIIEEEPSVARSRPTAYSWLPVPYPLALSEEQEREMLKGMAESLERQIDAAKKRLKELGEESNQ